MAPVASADAERCRSRAPGNQDRIETVRRTALAPDRGETKGAGGPADGGAGSSASAGGDQLSVPALHPPLGALARPELQRTNQVIANQLIEREAAWRRAAFLSGFTSNALAMTESILAHWRGMASATNTIWPNRPANRWLMEKIAARTDQAGSVWEPSSPTWAPVCRAGETANPVSCWRVAVAQRRVAGAG